MDYFWIPEPDNVSGHWEDFIKSLVTNYHGRLILRTSGGHGGPYFPRTRPPEIGTFAGIAEGDRLIIPAHGILSTTEWIGWVGTTTGVQKWHYNDLARVIAAKLGANKSRKIVFELWACWAGDKHNGRECFGGMFASALGKLGVKGSVVAYRGKVSIGTNKVWVKGTGRFTSWFGTSQRSLTLNNASSGKGERPRNFLQGDHGDVRVFWPIP